MTFSECLTLARRKSAISRGISALIVIALVLVLVGLVLYLNYDLNVFEVRFAPASSSNNSPVTSGLALYVTAVVAPSGSPGALMITVSENNTLDMISNVSVSDSWQYSTQYLNPYNSCGAPGPVGFAILRGNYDTTNYTKAQALDLYNPSETFVCTTFTPPSDSYYSFQPQSDQAILVYPKSSPDSSIHTTLSISFTAKGYWTSSIAGASSFHGFSVGDYTVLAADEWGKVTLTHVQISHA